MKKLMLLMILCMIPLVSAVSYFPQSTVTTYDDFADNSINWTDKWYNSSQSTIAYAEKVGAMNMTMTNPPGTRNGYFYSNTTTFPPLEQINNLTIQIQSIFTCSAATGGFIINNIFSESLEAITFSACTPFNVWSNWTIEKNYSDVSNYTVYRNGVFNTTIKPSGNNQFYSRVNNGIAGGTLTLQSIWWDVSYTRLQSINTTLVSPINNATIETLPIEFNTTLSTNNISTLKNATIYIWNATGNIVNQSSNTSLANYSQDVFFEADNLIVGSHTWNVQTCDSNDNCGWGDNNESFIYGFVINSETFDTPVGDLTNTTFTINVTYSGDILTDTASFIYNGTSYSVTKTEVGPDTIYTRVLDIPAVDTQQTRQFYWRFFTTNGGAQSFNTTINNQVVNPTGIWECNATYPTLGLNFTIQDESTKTDITADFDATFTWNLGGSQSKNKSFELDGSSSYAFCIDPNATYYTDIALTLSKTGYSTRMFYLNDEIINNVSQYQTLYLLNDTVASRIIIEVKDEGLAPLSNYNVQIWRYVPETGSFILVEEQITDTFGQFAAKLVENDVRYKFDFYDSTGTLKRSAERTNIVCRSTICVLSFIIQDTEDDFSPFDDLTDHDSTLIYDNATRRFIFTWNDNRGESSPTHQLLVYQHNLNGTMVFCNTTSTSLTGTINCNLPTNRASYTAQAFRIQGGTTSRLHFLTTKIGDYASTFGIEGLFWVMLLLFTISAALVFSPVVSMMVFVVGFLFLGITGLVHTNPAVMVAVAVIGGLVIWAFRS